MSSINPDTTPLTSRATALLAATILLFGTWIYFTHLGRAPLRIEAEMRCSEIVEAMVKTHDYAIPRIEGEPRPNKPPMFYWSAVAAARAAGHYSLAALRTPSALAGVALLFLSFAWGHELKRREIALLAALLLVVNYSIMSLARRGSMEMLFALFCGASLFFCYRTARRGKLIDGLAAAIFFGLGFLTKATPILLYVPLPMILWLFGMRQNGYLRRPATYLLSLLALAIGLSWYIYLWRYAPDTLATVYSEAALPFGVHVQAHHTAAHHEPFWFFAANIWLKFVPLSLFIPLVAMHAWRLRGYPRDSWQRLMLITFVASFLILSAIPQKQDHYILPDALPLALLTADAIFAVVAPALANARAPRDLLFITVPLWICGAAALIAGVASAVCLRLISDSPLWPTVLFGLIVAVISTAAMLEIRRMNLLRSAALLLPAFCAIWWAYFGVLHQIEDEFGSGAIFKSASYDENAWKAKFKKYPFLETLLDVEHGQLRLKRKK